ncbi:MAG: hypothetical protein J5806_04695 [Lentisphaeria bacterium]|nr:hypothetical protein [Lentisphaeria bacterium]
MKERSRFRRFLRSLSANCGLPGLIVLLLFRLVISAGSIAAGQTEKVPNHESPLQRLANDRIRHDAWLGSGRNLPSNALQKLRTARPNGRLNGRRHSQQGSGWAVITASAERPLVVPNDSDGLNPCRNPSFHSFRNRSCPVRAGPLFLS